MCAFLILICFRYLRRASSSESSETAPPLTMALLQQLQLEQAFADTWDFTLHVVSYQAEIEKTNRYQECTDLG
jgi:hypothetical protein